MLLCHTGDAVVTLISDFQAMNRPTSHFQFHWHATHDQLQCSNQQLEREGNSEGQTDRQRTLK